MREKLRAEFTKLRGMKFREAVGYLWDYYRFQTIAVLGAIVFIISLTVTIRTNLRYRPALRCGVLNTVRFDAAEYLDETSRAVFGKPCDETGGIGMITCYEPSDSANYGAVQLLCQLAANGIDLILCDTELMDYLSKDGALGSELTAHEITDTPFGARIGASPEHPFYLVEVVQEEYREAADRFLAYVLEDAP